MTLVVGLKCRDGIVMGSDGQATGGSAGGPVRIPSQKIFKISENVLFGAAGSVGVIQKSREVIMSFSKQLNEEWNRDLMENIRRTLFGVYKNEIERHKTFYQGTPQQDIKFAPISDILLCKYSNKQQIIWHIAPDCSDERLEEMGYGCSGNGDIFAHTLLKNYLAEEMDLERGKIVVYRVIKEAVSIGAFGLGEPIDIWTITRNGIKRIERNELMALDTTYNTWREMEREVFKRIYGDIK